MSALNLLPTATANHSPLPHLQRTPLRTLAKPVFQACGAQQMITGIISINMSDQCGARCPDLSKVL